MSDWVGFWLVADDLSELPSDERTDCALFDGRAAWRTMMPSGPSIMFNSLAMTNRFARFAVRSLAAW
jgi:hypothetical protein